jgi:hypothetical protein
MPSVRQGGRCRGMDAGLLALTYFGLGFIVGLCVMSLWNTGRRWEEEARRNKEATR